MKCWELSARDPLDARALERHARSLEPPQAVAVRGISKSAVSERFVYGAGRELGGLRRSRFSNSCVG
ncbi:MAG: hypothetical protein ACREQ4_06225 [Candidatus Binataceae bacterium]